MSLSEFSRFFGRGGIRKGHEVNLEPHPLGAMRFFLVASLVPKGSISISTKLAATGE